MFRDEYELLTGVPAGRNAFWILSQPRPQPKPQAPKKAYRQMTKTEKSASALMTPEERRQWREQQAALRGDRQTIAIKKARAKGKQQAFSIVKAALFNTVIASQADTDRTNSIARKK